MSDTVLGHKTHSATVFLAVFLTALGGLSQADAAECWAENRSTTTTCAEDDNVNVPISAPSVEHYLVIATHPAYCPCYYDPTPNAECQPDWTGCPPPGPSGTDTWEVAEDGGDNINDVQVHTLSDWWRSAMSVEVNGQGSYACHYFAIYRKAPGENRWPGVFVLYQDGNMRIKPYAPSGYYDVCYGSSVIVGPATLASRPYADIDTVQITTGPSSIQLDIMYAGSETAHIEFTVDRTRAVADVTVSGFPDHIAVFRSMYVTNGNADVDSVGTPVGSIPILSAWDRLDGTTWFFHRQYWSTHNTSAPDIRICVDTPSVFRVDESGTVYTDGDFRGAAFQTGAADVAERVHVSVAVSAGDVLELDPMNPGYYRKSLSACSTLIAGVVSTEPGVILGRGGAAGEALLALAGIVHVKVTNEGGSILPGDLLVTSSTPGHAMRWSGHYPCPCALIGKALEPMTDEMGMILVLLTAH